MVRFLSNKIFFLVLINNLAHLSDDNGQILWRDAIYDYYADGSVRRRQIEDPFDCQNFDFEIKWWGSLLYYLNSERENDFDARFLEKTAHARIIKYLDSLLASCSL